MPIQFRDLMAEVNFLALYHLLDFGSGAFILTHQGMR
jgi:hypothetical protein